MEKRCEFCGIRFHAYRNSERFCPDHKTTWSRREKPKKPRKKRSAREPHRYRQRTCKYIGCGREFLAIHNRQYCSPECQRKARNDANIANERERQPLRGVTHFEGDDGTIQAFIREVVGLAGPVKVFSREEIADVLARGEITHISEIAYNRFPGEMWR